jgi:hypothetical protein
LKSSLKIVDQPEGGPGTVWGAASAPGATGRAGAAEADCAVGSSATSKAIAEVAITARV